tara:strand:- start:3 stop:362 length:360 start_codon:yes stop_codon:yes gene_type:complete
MAVHYIKSPDLQNNTKLKSHSEITTFDRNELNDILSVYGKNVAQGIWKDYAIDHMANYAVFSIYRNTFEKAYISIRKYKYKYKKQKRYILLNINQKRILESNTLIDITHQLKSRKLKIV